MKNKLALFYMSESDKKKVLTIYSEKCDLIDFDCTTHTQESLRKSIIKHEKKVKLIVGESVCDLLLDTDLHNKMLENYCERKIEEKLYWTYSSDEFLDEFMNDIDNIVTNLVKLYTNNINIRVIDYFFDRINSLQSIYSIAKDSYIYTANEYKYYIYKNKEILVYHIPQYINPQYFNLETDCVYTAKEYIKNILKSACKDIIIDKNAAIYKELKRKGYISKKEDVPYIVSLLY